MTKSNKFLSVFLALIMIISIIPMSNITASAEDSPTSGTCGENLTWTFDDSTGTLIISGSGAMEDYVEDNCPWKDLQQSFKIKSIIINNGVTTIGNYAFHSCDITSVTIPDSVTTIGENAFERCYSLTSVTIGDSVTSIGYQAFYYCGITSVTIPDSVTTIGERAFTSCRNLTSVTIPDSVTTIGDEAFYYCDSLTSVTIPNSVTTIGYRAFCACDSLASVTIGDSVTTIGDEAFYDCTNLKSVTMGDSVTTIGNYAFYYCDSLTTVTMGNSVKTIGDKAFCECTNLKSVTIPDSVKTIGDNVFEHCHSLTSVTIGNSVTTIGNYAFYYCRGLTSVIIPDSVTTIGDNAFCYCDSLTSVTIPDSVTTIGEFAFCNCSSLEELNVTDISSWCNISFDSSLSNPLYYTGVLKLNGKIVVDLVIPDGTERINDYAFYNYNSLTSITIPDSVTSIHYGAFANCDSLTDVYYIGTKEQWSNIKKYTYNEPLLNATIHYNSFGEHIHCYIGTAISPTCTTQGYTIYTCDCGDSYIDNYEEPSHTPKTIINPATCTVDGMEYVACEICGETLGTSIILPATGHIYENGFCTVCGEKDPSYTEEPEYNYTFSIQTPSRTEIRNKDGIILHANVEGTAPNGSYVRWESSNGNFDKSADGSNLKIIAKNKGWTTFTAILCDADGNELARDSVDMYSKSGFFDKIGGFFRSLFGSTKIYEN